MLGKDSCLFTFEKRSTTTVENELLHDERLSRSAKGLACIMLSLPSGWKFNRTHITSFSKDREGKFKSDWKELETYCYGARVKVQVEGGRFRYDYLIHSEPISIKDIDNWKRGRIEALIKEGGYDD
jgi:hypothetical protein